MGDRITPAQWPDAVGQSAFVSARQQGEQPGLAGGHDGQDLLDLLQRPVVGQLAGGHTPPILQWQTLPESLPRDTDTP